MDIPCHANPELMLPVPCTTSLLAESGYRNIFNDDQNRDNFVERLETVLEQTRTGWYSEFNDLRKRSGPPV